MNYYNNTEELFKNLIIYNESNIELLGEMQIPITNIYYLLLVNNNDILINSIFDYLTDNNDFNPLNNFSKNLSFEKEQICKINIVKNTLKEIEKEINNLVSTTSVSNAKIVLVLDIGLLFEIINIFKENEQEIHLYDFLVYKLKNLIDELYILDTKNILKIEDKMSSVFDELNIYLKKNKIISPNSKDNLTVSIYKKHDSLYWNLLLDEQKIELADENYIDELNNKNDFFEKNTFIIIDDEECILLNNIPLLKLCFSNLYEQHKYVLDPIDKLKIHGF